MACVCARTAVWASLPHTPPARMERQTWGHSALQAAGGSRRAVSVPLGVQPCARARLLGPAACSPHPSPPRRRPPPGAPSQPPRGRNLRRRGAVSLHPAAHASVTATASLRPPSAALHTPPLMMHVSSLKRSRRRSPRVPPTVYPQK
jgi:hypothetical protein